MCLKIFNTFLYESENLINEFGSFGLLDMKMMQWNICCSRVIKCFEDSKPNLFDARLVLLLCFGWDLGGIECDPLLC